MFHTSQHKSMSQKQEFWLHGFKSDILQPQKKGCSPCSKGPTWFAVCPRVHDDELWPELADAPPLEDGHESSQVLQVECVAGPPNLWVILCALHGAVQPLIASWGVADKVSHVVGIWNRGLEAGHRQKKHIWDSRKGRQTGRVQTEYSLCATSATSCISPVSCGRKARKEEQGGWEGYLDGGNEGSGQVGTESRGQGQLADVLIFSKGTGNGLLAQQLEAGHSVLYSNHIQGWSWGHKQPGVPMAPTDGDDGALPGKGGGSVKLISGN